jgi:hypothetical protein
MSVRAREKPRGAEPATVKLKDIFSADVPKPERIDVT